MTKRIPGGAPMRIVPMTAVAGRPQWRVEEYRKGWFFYDWHLVTTTDRLFEAQRAVAFLQEQAHA